MVNTKQLLKSVVPQGSNFDSYPSSCVSAPQKEEDFGGFGVSDGNTLRTSQDTERYTSGTSFSGGMLEVFGGGWFHDG